MGVAAYTKRLPEFDLRNAEIELAPSTGAAQALHRALREPVRLGPMAGLPELRERLSQLLTATGLTTRAEQVVVTAGASGALAATLSALTKPGDAVLLPDPGFPGHSLAVAALDRLPLYYPMPYGARDVNALAVLDSMAGQSAALVWVSPHNPTGRICDDVLARSVARIAADHRLLVIADEVFHDLSWTRPHVSVLAHADPELAVGIWSGSKSLRLPGARTGWLRAPEALASRLAEAAWALTMSAPVLGQIACLASLDDYDATVRRSRQHVWSNLRSLRAGIETCAPVRLPDGGTCVWFDIGWSGLNSRDFVSRLRASHHVRIWPGSRFGARGDGFVRISAGPTGQEVRDGIEGMQQFMINLAARQKCS